jgi:hypothetical protein
MFLAGPRNLAQVSPYLTEHINRFGEYSTRELGTRPEAYDSKLDAGFTRCASKTRPRQAPARPLEAAASEPAS